LDFNSSIITIMHGPINIRGTNNSTPQELTALRNISHILDDDDYYNVNNWSCSKRVKFFTMWRIHRQRWKEMSYRYGQLVIYWKDS